MPNDMGIGLDLRELRLIRAEHFPDPEAGRLKEG